jgi:hypothetical protein
MVVVHEINEAPLLAPIGNKMVNAGQQLAFALTASDPNLPPQILAFTVDGMPEGASLDSSAGYFKWTTPVISATTTNLLAFHVTDSGSPPLRSSETIQVIIVAAPRFTSITMDQSGGITLFWKSQPGKTYRILYTSELSTGPWSPLGDDIKAIDSVTSRMDPFSAVQPRFYRILQVD